MIRQEILVAAHRTVSGCGQNSSLGGGSMTKDEKVLCVTIGVGVFLLYVLGFAVGAMTR